MDRRQAIRAAGILMAQAAVGKVATGQDFGALLEDFGKDILRQQLTPENIQRTLKPHLTGETVPIQTADGWTLVAHRFRPATGVRPGTMPVILCHGLSYNAQFWDISPEVSLPNFLAERGWDVWVVNLRGSGLSSKWVAKLDAAPTMVVGGLIRRATNNKIAPTGYATLDPKFARWNLDDHINYDLPALVHLVRSHTRAPEVAWVGHSMGGIIPLCHLARYQNPGIGRLVTVGSQVTMPDGQLATQFLMELIALRNGQLAGQILPEELLIDSKTSIDNMFFNQGHVSPQVYRALTHDGIDVPSIGLLQQYLVLAARKELLDAGKTLSYASMLPNVQVPILVSCGASDQLAPPQVQQTIYERVGSTDKTLLPFGRAQGFAADAGHSDALVGLTSRQQVYPTIENWLLGAR
ncbi:alpha/beta fold hydrolase [Tautonia plasticadhaerens]|uniref:Alpha/beta hydrolase family protein n=1 Tax=Tautonia plasticadhaerens TaxID=2527974 RepID=A0A518H7R7_9BACT|nr:alpha/beta fold hydrolase [Tautonia plasticadhaerens]QDV36865.1 Alpha/beta hydrolase family protein [Tautonia plasticadhaerens]